VTRLRHQRLIKYIRAEPIGLPKDVSSSSPLSSPSCVMYTSRPFTTTKIIHSKHNPTQPDTDMLSRTRARRGAAESSSATPIPETTRRTRGRIQVKDEISTPEPIAGPSRRRGKRESVEVEDEVQEVGHRMRVRKSVSYKEIPVADLRDEEEEVDDIMGEEEEVGADDDVKEEEGVEEDDEKEKGGGGDDEAEEDGEAEADEGGALSCHTSAIVADSHRRTYS
jgi:hypothetical protein